MNSDLIKFNQDTLLGGEFPCPFNAEELGLLEALRDGFDGQLSDYSASGLKERAFRKSRRDIGEKINLIYPTKGDDYLAKALSISILGGWVDASELEGKDTKLDDDDFLPLFNRCFGDSTEQVILEHNLTPIAYNKMFMNIKRGLKVQGDYRVIAWGASKARRWLIDNPDIRPAFFTT